MIFSVGYAKITGQDITFTKILKQSDETFCELSILERYCFKHLELNNRNQILYLTKYSIEDLFKIFAAHKNTLDFIKAYSSQLNKLAIIIIFHSEGVLPYGGKKLLNS